MVRKDLMLVIAVMLFAGMFFILSAESLPPTGGATGTKSVSVSTTARVTVLPIFNLSVDIRVLNEVVSSGENLFVLVDLKKKDLIKFKSSPRIYVNLNYEILKGNKVVKKGFLERTPIIKYNRETVSIRIPQDYSGSYDVKIIATEGQSYTAKDKDDFFAKKKWKGSY